MTILHWESSIVRCCMYSHCTVLDSAGSKIYRGLVESVGMKKSAGEDDQYSYIWYIHDIVYVIWYIFDDPNTKKRPWRDFIESHGKPLVDANFAKDRSCFQNFAKSSNLEIFSSQGCDWQKNAFSPISSIVSTGLSGRAVPLQPQMAIMAPSGRSFYALKAQNLVHAHNMTG